MDDQVFASTSRIVATGLADMARRHSIDADEAANLVACACAQAMAQLLNPAVAVERLRDIADHLEADLLAA